MKLRVSCGEQGCCSAGIQTASIQNSLQVTFKVAEFMRLWTVLPSVFLLNLALQVSVDCAVQAQGLGNLKRWQHSSLIIIIYLQAAGF